MRVVCSSDWHADYVSHGIRRHEEIDRAVTKTVEAASKADAYIFTGDLANPDNGASTIRAIGLAVRVASYFASIETHSFWVSGNHDVVEDSSGDTTLSPLRGISERFVHVFERPRVVVLPQYTVIGLPYPGATAPYNPMELDMERMLVEAKHTEGNPIIVASHLTNIPGVERGEESSEMSRGRDVGYPVESVSELAEGTRRLYAFQGHFHKRQSVPFPHFTLEIPGALARLTFGEERHQPCFLVAEIE